MKFGLIILLLIHVSFFSVGQVLSGEYESGLKIAFDKESNKITGYYEDYSGWDAETNAPRFSCIFYIDGTVDGNKFAIKTSYPSDEEGTMIEGSLKFDSTFVSVILNEDHGGCHNVQKFSVGFIKFKLTKQKAWIQIKYIIADKSYFYSDKSNGKMESFVVKKDFVCIDKIEGEWAYCTYYGKEITIGWIRVKDMN